MLVTTELRPFFVEMDLPPSTNDLHFPRIIYKEGKPIAISSTTNRYRDWKKVAAAQILAAKAKDKNARRLPIVTCTVEIDAWLPEKYDLDNAAKPVLDALQNAGVLKNDKHVVRLEMVKHLTGAKKIEVRIHG